MSELNDKQRRFAHEYIVDLNATKAAIRAGYSEKTARSQGQRLLTNVDILKLVEDLMQQKDDELIAKQDEVLRYLTKVMRREEPEHTAVVIKKSASKWVEGPDGKPKKVTESWEEPQLVAFPTKVTDANRAAELIGKRYALFTDRQEVEVTTPVFIEDVPVDD